MYVCFKFGSSWNSLLYAYSSFSAVLLETIPSVVDRGAIEKVQANLNVKTDSRALGILHSLIFEEQFLDQDLGSGYD